MWTTLAVWSLALSPSASLTRCVHPATAHAASSDAANAHKRLAPPTHANADAACRARQPHPKMFLEQLKAFFQPDDADADERSSGAAVSRLKVVLAHDRSGVDETTMAAIRKELQDVVAKYVTIDEENVNFDIMTDERLTLLTATFPLSQSRAVADRSLRAQTQVLQMDVATKE